MLSLAFNPSKRSKDLSSKANKNTSVYQEKKRKQQAEGIRAQNVEVDTNSTPYLSCADTLPNEINFQTIAFIKTKILGALLNCKILEFATIKREVIIWN